MEDRDTRDRVIALEAHVADQGRVLDKMNGKLDCLLAKSIERDERMSRVETTVSTMAPSVEAVKNGLVFWRIARWAVGIIAGAGAYFYGIADILKAVFTLAAQKKP